MSYADWDYYRDDYLGIMIPQTDFNRMSKRASDWLDYFTQNRITNEFANDTSVKNACCAIAEGIFSSADGSMNSRTITNETNSKQSVSYAGSTSINDQLINTALIYLGNSNLIARAMPYKTGAVDAD